MESFTYSIFLGFVTGLTLITQAYMLYVIRYYSPKSMSEYQYFLNTFTVFDMIFTIIIGIITVPFSVEKTFGAWFIGLSSYFSPQVQLFWLAAGFYGGAMVVQSQDYAMIYRFSVIYSETKIHQIFMSKWSKIAFIILQQSIAIFLAILAYLGCVQPDKFQERIQLESAEIQQMFREHGFFIWFDIEKDMMCLIFFGTMVVCFIISEILCGILVCLIMVTMKRNSKKFSANTYKLNRQLTVVLALQIASPIFFIIFPVTATIVSGVVFGHYLGRSVVQLGFLLIDMYALSNTLFTLLFISPYRVHLLNVMNSICLKPILEKFKIGVPHQLNRVSTVTAFTNSRQSHGIIRNIPRTSII